MKLWVVGLALIGVAACQPGVSSDQPEPELAPPAEQGVRPAAYPEARGPVANYFRAEMPATFQGRWASQDAACAGEDAFVIGANTIASPALSAEIDDIEVNEAGGEIIDVIANGVFSFDGQSSRGRASMKLSVDGARLLVVVLGQASGPALPPELVRCR